MAEPSLSRRSVLCLTLFSGLAALSWQVVWQIKSSLALGVSAWGTALTLATTMGGMCIGSLVMGYALKNRRVANPLRIYGTLECLVGVLGLFLNPAFREVERIDTWAWNAMPGSAPAVHLLGIALSIGAAALCMGATLPVFGLVARQARASISTLYSLNTLGAAAGALIAAFIVIPQAGITNTVYLIAGLNVFVGLIALAFGRGVEPAAPETSVPLQPTIPLSLPAISAVVFITGFATFALEVAWFRSLTAAFRSTTDAFAIMLAAVLVALGAGASLVPLLRLKKISIGSLLSWAGILILLTTPLVERFDLVIGSYSIFALLKMFDWFAMTLFVIGPAILCLGVSLPWILDEQATPRRWGSLYALNTFAAILGSLSAGWIFLPTIGFTRTAWLIGALVTITGLMIVPKRQKSMLGALGLASLAVAVLFASGIGTTRIQGWELKGLAPKQILESFEGPDANTAAVEYAGGQRAIVIDGFIATFQSKEGQVETGEHYMPWMGHLPMLLDPDPKKALVICFGTGQTANAVRNENPGELDIVDITPPASIKLAHNFVKNQDVLHPDPRVHATVMDGRAWIRRTQTHYDVITLEPMPPDFAGVNALYSKEFYEMARQKLAPHGVIAQWVPFHLVAPRYGASIAKTFQSVFPNAIIWADPRSRTGILLGSVDDGVELGKDLAWLRPAASHPRFDGTESPHRNPSRSRWRTPVWLPGGHYHG